LGGEEKVQHYVTISEVTRFAQLLDELNAAMIRLSSATVNGSLQYHMKSDLTLSKQVEFVMQQKKHVWHPLQ
jgi:hypothetical protein